MPSGFPRGRGWLPAGPRLGQMRGACARQVHEPTEQVPPTRFSLHTPGTLWHQLRAVLDLAPSAQVGPPAPLVRPAGRGPDEVSSDPYAPPRYRPAAGPLTRRGVGCSASAIPPRRARRWSSRVLGASSGGLRLNTTCRTFGRGVGRSTGNPASSRHAGRTEPLYIGVGGSPA